MTVTAQGEGASVVPTRAPWDADSAAPGGLTSLDVLLKWMLTPGRYEFLHGDQRSSVIHNILASLKRNNIEHRTESSIRSKICSIESQYLFARQWLEARSINGDDVVTGRADSETQAAVLSICPHYCELMPIFRDSSYLNAMASTRAQGEVVDEKKEKPARSKAKRKMRSKAQTPSKRRLTTPAQAQPYSGFYEHKEQDRADLARVLDCVRRTTYGKVLGSELDLSGDQDWFQRTDHCQLVLRDSDTQLPPE
ncbi:hypothetical protein GN958_ATG05990 [Phytophthora infestans]|uniref:Uncharacterized protein n=1 Tax=Phytophthora infestans TaxID=4787 RepID=A0A8S9V055_PHYIN|nr:hypothetical protein GN958_ATG05990 [Phytophthora infestans]